MWSRSFSIPYRLRWEFSGRLSIIAVRRGCRISYLNGRNSLRVHALTRAHNLLKNGVVNPVCEEVNCNDLLVCLHTRWLLIMEDTLMAQPYEDAYSLTLPLVSSSTNDNGDA